MIANAPTAPVEYVGTHAGEDDEFNPRLSAEARLDTASRLLWDSMKGSARFCATPLRY